MSKTFRAILQEEYEKAATYKAEQSRQWAEETWARIKPKVLEAARNGETEFFVYDTEVISDEYARALRHVVAQDNLKADITVRQKQFFEGYGWKGGYWSATIKGWA